MSGTMIFGGTGSLGKALIRRFMKAGTFLPIYPFSRDEAKHWTIRNEIVGQPNSEHVRFVVGDVRDFNRVREAIRRYQPDTIIIAAALKQVDTCELSPEESVLTNLIGTQNVVRAVKEHNESSSNTVKSVLFVSTDKACAPVNVYGMCKAISERLVTSQSDHKWPTRFLGVRYGNVLESRGSIIPLFRYQAEFSDSLTVTDPEMTRFVMTLDDSVDLILTALEKGVSGEIWIPRLKSMKIGHLAEVFSTRYRTETGSKPIRITGLRPGEKMHEALINESESVRTDVRGNHYVIRPAFSACDGSRFTYTSEDDVMSYHELKAHLTKLGVLDCDISEFEGTSIEHIRTNLT